MEFPLLHYVFGIHTYAEVTIIQGVSAIYSKHICIYPLLFSSIFHSILCVIVIFLKYALSCTCINVVDIIFIFAVHY